MFGNPLILPESGGWVLRRSIHGTAFSDAMGCYPLFCCHDWRKIENDLIQLAEQGELISVVLVTDPFCTLTPDQMAQVFTGACYPFKAHHIIDLSVNPDVYVDMHHRRNARWSGRHVHVERVENPLKVLEEWISLYDMLIARHCIRGIACFSRESFTRQFQIPGLVVFRAVVGNETVGMAMFYIHGNTGFYHLGAYSSDGYRFKASFALFWEAIARFRQEGMDFLDLGGGAGAFSDGCDGLNRFKRGWATGTRPAYLCGRVLNGRIYARLSEGRFTAYFPAYRQGEFT
ncbi:MAG: GNAT family N-acetyltransferase [Deltaproteobacteria bacterium]|nr:GNAT family N-acetyltransferase [Deltaproteobacteria bacterium]